MPVPLPRIPLPLGYLIPFLPKRDLASPDLSLAQLLSALSPEKDASAACPLHVGLPIAASFWQAARC